MVYFLANLLYLIASLLKIYVYLFLLRFFLQLCRANYFNPVIQFLVKFTDFAVQPFRHIIPSFRHYDLATLLLAIICELAAISLNIWANPKAHFMWLGMILLLIGQLLDKTSYIYIAAIIINAICSWLPILAQNHAMSVIVKLIYPVMKRAQKLIAPIGGIDLSPVIILLVIYILQLLIINPLLMYSNMLLSS